MGFHFLSNSGGKLNRAGHQGHFKKIVYWSHVARHIHPESIQTGNCLATARASVWIPFDRHFISSHIRLIPSKMYVRFGTCCFTRSASFLVKNDKFLSNQRFLWTLRSATLYEYMLVDIEQMASLGFPPVVQIYPHNVDCTPK